MEQFTQRNFASVWFFLLAIIVGFSVMRDMPIVAAFSCAGPGELQIESQSPGTSFVTQNAVYCHHCQDECITKCLGQQGRQVSKVECNFWGSEPAVCKCCCASTSSTQPPQQPIAWNKCPTEETNFYKIIYNTPIDCKVCVNNCKTQCDAIEGTVTREVCFQSYSEPSKKLYKDLVCPCCCKKNPPPPPSSQPPPPSPPPPPPTSPPPPPPPSQSHPPPPPLSPPPPSPSPPPPPTPAPCPPTENTCEAEDLYLAFQLPSTSECDLCLRDCKTKCSKLGSSMASDGCKRKSSAVFCKCCCTDNPPPPPPTSSPPPPPPPMSSPPPPPPLEKTCDAGDIDSVLKLMGSGRRCDRCNDYCPDKCSSQGRYLATNFCITEPTVVLCHCCCRSYQAISIPHQAVTDI